MLICIVRNGLAADHTVLPDGMVISEDRLSANGTSTTSGIEHPVSWSDQQGGLLIAVTAEEPIGATWTAEGGFVAPPATEAELTAYANARQWALATGGFTLAIGGQSLTFTTDTVSQGLMTGKYIRLAQPNAPASVSWQLASGFVSIAAADFGKAALAIADFVQATFDALSAVLGAIAAGTITSTAAVDAAAWPANVAH